MRRVNKFIISLFIYALIFVIYLYGFKDLLTFETIQHSYLSLIGFKTENILLSLSIFIAVYFLVTIFALPGSELFNILAGVLFGFLPALSLCLCLRVLGGSIQFILARTFLRQAISDKYGAKLRQFENSIEQNGVIYLLLIRLIPLLPFSVVNFLSGLSRIPLPKFFIITLIGMLFPIAIYIYVGVNIGDPSALAMAVLFRIILAAFALIILFRNW